ncbi:ABC transporter ATP-binding protein [Carnobacterium divergens]|nr:ABC transporter ATP-binding protein [Carnobacterium divergens]MDO0875167.1 ABC transporter ATP-binding protein [Carnobacterium divergens]SUX18547.1 Uncharacterized ABC transporter ATP-binding protein YbhF [Carnobacterium divergens]
MKAIEALGLTKMYHKKAAVDHIDLIVEEGEIYGFIGPNGAGKSTTIKTLLNFIYPTSGSASILGLDCVKESQSIKKQVSYVSSDVRFYPAMNAMQIMKYVADFHNLKNAKPIINHYFDYFEIDPKKKLGEMSLGNKKKVAVVSGLIANPRMMILDEPTNGLDPLMQHRLFEVLKEKNQKGMTLFLSSHDLTEVQRYCSKAAFIKEGKIISIEDITADRIAGKVVELVGNNLPKEKFIAIGAKLIQQSDRQLKFFYNGDMQILLPLLINSEIKDVLIKNQELEDKFMTMYEKGALQ